MSTLTRVKLPISNSTVRRRLSSPQVIHAIVQAAGASDTGRTLWRVDAGETEHVLYLVAPGAVDTAHVAGEFGLPESQVLSRDYEPVLRRLSEGQDWRFRLRANPVKAEGRSTEGKRSAIHALRREPEQVAWLLRKAESAGFTVPTNRLGVPEVVTGGRDAMTFKGSSQPRVSIEAVTFDGILRVRDVEALHSALTSGLGRAKAYGCGLMTLAPVGM